MTRRALKSPSPARRVLAVMWRPDFDIEKTLPMINQAFGDFASDTGPFEFSHSGYYEAEMGSGLCKRFIEIKGLQPRDSLADWKLKTTEFEHRFEAEGKRPLNVDPMLVSMENVVIATSKNFPHRVYLREGVYGDLGLIRRKGGFEALPWSYADYVEWAHFFDGIHARLKTAGR
jgi:hypothetical protein